MKIKLYQIAPEKDDKNLIFCIKFHKTILQFLGVQFNLKSAMCYDSIQDLEIR